MSNPKNAPPVFIQLSFHQWNDVKSVRIMEIVNKIQASILDVNFKFWLPNHETKIKENRTVYIHGVTRKEATSPWRVLHIGREKFNICPIQDFQ